MSRREDRSSESKRHRSRFDREPSPKRSRRDGKPETERPPAEPDMDKDRPERDHRNHRRLQDPLPLESVNVGRESEKGTDAQKGVTKHSSDATKVPRSYFQHDDSGQNGRGFSRRTDSERGWWRDPIPKEQRNDSSLIETRHKDEKSKDSRDVWRHDVYFEMEVNPKPPPRRRPSFREQKMPSDTKKTDRAANDSVMPNPQDRAIEYGRRNDRGYNTRYSDRPVAGERESNKAQSWRGNFPSGDRFNGNNRQRERERDRFPARQGYYPTGCRAEKWKRDLYDEANKSPPPKNEDDQISKIESLLAS